MNDDSEDNKDGLQGNLLPQDTPEYLAMNLAMQERFLCRSFPLPDCYHASYDHMQRKIFTAFRGPSEICQWWIVGSF